MAVSDSQANEETLRASEDGPEMGQSLTLEEIPDVEEVPGQDELPYFSPIDAIPMSKSTYSGILNVIKGIPPCVWVRNASKEDITVVVSRFGPLRTLTGAGLDASASGGGIKFSAETFTVGATKKSLPGCLKEGSPSTARFPLWSKSTNAGVVTIYRSLQNTLFIENDRLPAGSIGVFQGTSDLAIYDHNGRKMSSDPPLVDLGA